MDSGLGDFFRQIPTVLVATFCLSAITLVIALAYIVRARANRHNAVTVGASAAAAFASEPGELLPDLDALTTSPPVQPARAGTFRVELAEGEAVDVVEVLSVLRDVADGSLIVQIGGKAYRNPPASADAEFKRRFNLTIRELSEGKRGTAGVQPAPVAAPTPPPPAPKPNVAAPPPVEASLNAPLPGDLPKFKMPDQPEVPSRRRSKPTKEAIPEINIAAAIESYLQHKLANAPAYAGRSIHVRSASNGGVEIDVDGHVYDAVGEVEDAEIREFLTTTIAEWQARQ